MKDMIKYYKSKQFLKRKYFLLVDVRNSARIIYEKFISNYKQWKIFGYNYNEEEMGSPKPSIDVSVRKNIKSDKFCSDQSLIQEEIPVPGTLTQSTPYQ
jgi:hypothetical protein